MKKSHRFIDYLRKNGWLSTLTEAAMKIAFAGEKTDVKLDPNRPFGNQRDAMLAGRWSGISPLIVIKLMRFSPNWKDDIDSVTATGKITPDQTQAFKKAGTFKVDAEAAGSRKFTVDMKFPGKKQGLLMGALKANRPTAMKIKFANGLITGDFNDMLDAAYVIGYANKLAGGWIPRKGGDNALSPDEIASAEADVKTVEGNDDGLVNVKIAGRVSAFDDYLKISGENALAGLDLAMDANTNLITYDMVWLVDRMIETGGKLDDDAIRLLRKQRFGFMLRSYLNSLEENANAYAMEQKQKNAPNGRTAEEEFNARLSEVKLIDVVNKFENDVKAITGNDQDDEKLQVKPKLPAAVRRVKLFEDAEYYGAQVIKVNGWIAAVCRTYDQVHTFGRTKPKVIKGTNDINPDLNLRDDEIEAKFKGDAAKIAKLKAERDRQPRKNEYVKDGIGYDEQSFEAGWCVAGGNAEFGGIADPAWGPGVEARRPNENWKTGSYFKCKKRGQRMPLIVYLQIKTGKLYCSNCSTSKWGYPIGNGWYQYDFNTEKNGQNDGGIKTLMASDPQFVTIYKKANAIAFKGYTDPYSKRKFDDIYDPPDIEHIIPDDVHAAKVTDYEITDNGIMVFKSRDSLFEQVDQLKNPAVTVIKLVGSFDNAFANAIIPQNIRVIDCSEVTSARNMFSETVFSPDIDKLTLVSTAKCIHMRSMFEGAQNIPHHIGGIDTSSAADVDGMFANSTSKHNRGLIIPVLDLRHCSSINETFMNSPVTEVRFENADGITDMRNCITGCYMLSKFPNLYFDLKKTSFDGFDVKRVEDIFDGCTMLQKNPDFDENVQQLKEYYIDQFKRLKTTKEGYAIINTRREAEIYVQDPMKYHRGVKIGVNDASGMFSDLNNININILDLDGVLNAERMFYKAAFRHFGKIVNAGRLEKAGWMFSATNLKETPDAEFPSLKSCDSMFAKMGLLRSWGMQGKPNTKFGKIAVQEQLNDDFNPAEYLFGADADKTLRIAGGAAYANEKWLNECFQAGDAAATLWLKGRLLQQQNGQTCIGVDTEKELLTALKCLSLAKTFKADSIYVRTGFTVYDRRLNFDGHGLLVLGGDGDTPVCFNGCEILNLPFVDSVEQYFDARDMFVQSKLAGKGLRIKKACRSMTRMFKGTKSENCVTFETPPLTGFSAMEAFCMSENILKDGIKFADTPVARASSMLYCFHGADCCSGFDAIESVSAVDCSDAFSHSNIPETLRVVTLPNAKTCKGIFNECASLKSVQSFYAPECNNMSHAFEHCTNLQSAGMISFGHNAYVERMFADSQLEFILQPGECFASIDGSTGMFENAPAREMFGKNGKYLKLFLRG